MRVWSCDARELEVLPALAAVPMMHEVCERLAASNGNDPRRREAREEMAAEWAAFCGEVARHGIIEPLKVVRNKKGHVWTVVDGRKRLEAARAVGLAEVPVAEVEADQVEAIIEGTVVGRQHWTKGMRAYFAVLLHPEVALDRKVGRPQKSRTECVISAAELAERFGVSIRLIDQACEIYRHFAAKPTVRKRVEPSIWAGMGLGGVLAGIAGDPEGRPDEGMAARPRSLEVALKSWSTLGRFAGGWREWDEVQRDTFTDLISQVAAALPEEMRGAMIEALENPQAPE